MHGNPQKAFVSQTKTEESVRGKHWKILSGGVSFLDTLKWKNFNKVQFSVVVFFCPLLLEGLFYFAEILCNTTDKLLY